MGSKRGNVIHIAVIAGVTMIVAGAGDADADFISGGSVDFKLDAGPIPGNIEDSDILEFDLFDSTMGTLTDVTFTLVSTKSFSQDLVVDATNPSGNGEGEGTLDLDFDVNLAEFVGSLFNQMDVLSTFCDLESSQECSDLDEGDLDEGVASFDGTFIVSAGDIFNFNNSGGAFDIDVGFTGESSTEDDRSATANVMNEAVWDGTLSVRYDFTPTTPTPLPVPEPATLALFGAGLAGLGFLGRRRRRE